MQPIAQAAPDLARRLFAAVPDPCPAAAERVRAGFAALADLGAREALPGPDATAALRAALDPALAALTSRACTAPTDAIPPAR